MSLEKRFFLIAILSAITIVAVLWSLVSNSISGYVMSRNSGSTALYMESFLEPHVQSMADGAPLSQADLKALELVARDKTLREHVVAVKVWDTKGEIVFATDAELIGQQFPIDELIKPLAGEIEVYLDELSDEENEFERKFDFPIFEAYVPLRSTTDGTVLAVGEFYEDASKLKDYLSQLAWRNGVVLASGGFVLLAALYFVFKQGSQTIENQKGTIDHLKLEHQALLSATTNVEERMDVAREQLRDLDHLVRQRIGQELHDGPAQLLSYLMLEVKDLAKVESEGSDDQMLLQEIEQAAARALKEIREMSNRLLKVDQNAFLEGPVSLSETISDHETRSHITVSSSGLELSDMLPPAHQRALSKIVNEALNNGFKHASGAGQTVNVFVQSGKLIVEISDTGPGLPEHETLTEIRENGHQGMPGMQTHAESIGATLEISSEKGQFTLVRVILNIS